MHTVEKIHNEVFSAQDNILAKAKEIIAKEIPADPEKDLRIAKLKDLGFTKAKDVIEWEGRYNERNQAITKRGLIEYYAETYPMHRFIDEETVKEICKKYKLLLADAKNYTAEIPVKNQNDIINFRVRESDLKNSDMWGAMAQAIETHDQHTQRHRRIYDSFGSPMRTDDEGPQYAGFMGYLPALKAAKVEEYDPNPSNKMVPAKGIKIMAPEHMLDMKSNGNHKRGYILVDDPIVLQPVKGGYLIISCWGKEASDPKVSNSKHN
jgi:hypothetical protein